MTAFCGVLDNVCAAKLRFFVKTCISSCQITGKYWDSYRKMPKLASYSKMPKLSTSCGCERRGLNNAICTLIVFGFFCTDH